jgi:3-hydroxybutyryl-CoA dehydrogenase
MKNVAIIGAGTMGNGIAHTFAQKDFKVQLIDISQDSLDRGMATIAKNLDRMVAKERISEADKTSTLANISTFTTIAEGVVNASLVIEAATENLDLKLKIFKELDAVCSADTILATNTSSISITEIAAATSRPEMVIGMHFMNPVPIMKLVEIIKGYSTSDAT